MVGDHPYRVFLVTSRWTGGAPGRGEKLEGSRIELACGRDCNGRLVPPAVEDMGAFLLRHRILDVGTVEEGSIVVSEISEIGWIEAGLVNFERLKCDESSWFEVEQDGRDGDSPDRPRRRMNLGAPPYRDAQGCQWIIRLKPHSGMSEPFGRRGAL